MKNEPIPLELNPDDALVLFAFLCRFSDTDKLNIEDKAEWQALHNLLCLLEKELVPPFQEDYDKQLEKARASLRHE